MRPQGALHSHMHAVTSMYLLVLRRPATSKRDRARLPGAARGRSAARGNQQAQDASCKATQPIARRSGPSGAAKSRGPRARRAGGGRPPPPPPPPLPPCHPANRRAGPPPPPRAPPPPRGEPPGRRRGPAGPFPRRHPAPPAIPPPPSGPAPGARRTSGSAAGPVGGGRGGLGGGGGGRGGGGRQWWGGAAEGGPPAGRRVFKCGRRRSGREGGEGERRPPAPALHGGRWAPGPSPWGWPPAPPTSQPGWNRCTPSLSLSILQAYRQWNVGALPGWWPLGQSHLHDPTQAHVSRCAVEGPHPGTHGEDGDADHQKIYQTRPRWDLRDTLASTQSWKASRC